MALAGSILIDMHTTGIWHFAVCHLFAVCQLMAKRFFAVRFEEADDKESALGELRRSGRAGGGGGVWGREKPFVRGCEGVLSNGGRGETLGRGMGSARWTAVFSAQWPA